MIIGKKGQSAVEAASIFALFTFFMVITLAAVSDNIIKASDNNYNALLQDTADFVQEEARMAAASGNGYYHEFFLPTTLNNQPYEIGFINSTSISSNISILFVSSVNPKVPINVTRVMGKDVRGNLAVGKVSVTKENGIVIIRSVPAPRVLGVAPSSGPTNGGTLVTIIGKYFTATPTVLFGNANSPAVSFVDANTLTAVTPPGLLGAVDVKVINPDGQDGILILGFTYISPLAPTLSGLDITSGPSTGGTTVTITGTNFVNYPSVTAVSFGGVQSSTIMYVSNTKLQALTPANAPGPVAVTVTNPDGKSATLNPGFTYTAPPAITSFSPGIGPYTGGTTVTIIGTNFQPASTVTFSIGGDHSASFTYVSPTQLNVVSPSASVGGALIKVTNTDGQQATASFIYINSQIPIGTVFLTSATYTGNLGGLLGADSKCQALANTAGFGGTWTAWLSTSIVNAKDRITNNAYSRLDSAPIANSKNELIDGSITNIISLMDNGYVDSGSLVFTGTKADGTGYSLNTCNDWTSSAAAGRGISGNSALADSRWTDTTQGAGNAGLPCDQLGHLYCFKTSIYSGPAPAIQTVSPSVGALAGGTTVIVTGSNFVNGATVTFGSSQVSATFIDSSHLSAVTPAHAAGPVNVIVTNPDTQTAIANNAFTYALGPSITSLDVTSGPSGIWVLITGNNFVSAASPPLFGGTVKFGEVLTFAYFISSTQIKVITPSHANGVVDVVVTNPDGQSATRINGFTYTSALAPTITSITPTSGPTDIESVIITGTNIYDGAYAKFGGVNSRNAVFKIDGTLNVGTPAHAPGTVDVTVVNPDGQSATRTNGYTFMGPSITSVFPSYGQTSGGITASITGTNFATFFGNPAVKFGANSATVTYASNTQISVTLPAGNFGTVDITVTDPDGYSATKANAFTYMITPTITSLDVTTGPASGGTTVIINGNGFVNYPTTSAVSFGGVIAQSVTYLSGTQLRAVTPAHALGAVDVMVTNPDGQSGTKSGGFTYLRPAPTVLSLSPSSLIWDYGGHSLVTITGNNFVATPSVTFGGVPATNVAFINATQLTVYLPYHVPGTVDVTVTNPDGQSGTKSNAFTYLAPPPNIVQINPLIGPYTGGTSVLILGTDFVATPTVTFGGTAATSVILGGGTQLMVVTPAHAAGAVDVVVTNPDGQSGTKVGAFTYYTPVGTVFVTSATYSGSLGGLAGADAKCQALANAKSLGGTWKAWLSTSAVNAKDRITDAVYRKLDGVIVANSLADLTDGSISSIIDLAEDNTRHSGFSAGSYVWTGTGEDGNKLADTCGDWNNYGLQGVDGFVWLTNYWWTNLGSGSCSNQARLYCFKTS